MVRVRYLPNAFWPKEIPSLHLYLTSPHICLCGSPYLLEYNLFTSFSSLSPVSSLKVGTVRDSSLYNLNILYDKYTHSHVWHTKVYGIHEWMDITSNLASLEHLVSQRANKTLDSQAELIAEEGALHSLQRMCIRPQSQRHTSSNFPPPLALWSGIIRLTSLCFILLSYKMPIL